MSFNTLDTSACGFCRVQDPLDTPLDDGSDAALDGRDETPSTPSVTPLLARSREGDGRDATGDGADGLTASPDSGGTFPGGVFFASIGEAPTNGEVRGEVRGDGVSSPDETAPEPAPDSAPGSASASETGPDFTLDDTPSATLDPASRAALETRGREFVDTLVAQEDKGLSAERAGELHRNPDLLAQIGALLGNEDPDVGVRAASVLIGGVNNATRDGADGHISGLVQRGDLDLETFTALANDFDFLITTREFLRGSENHPGAGASAIDRYIDRAEINVAEGRDPMDNSVGVYPSRDGLLFHIPDVPVADSGGTRNDGVPLYVNAGNQPLPEELQRVLAERGATPGGIDPETLAAARLMTDARGAGPGEQLAVASFQNGFTDLAAFREQLADPAFLESPATARAADVLLGPDRSPGEAFVGKLYRDGYIDTDTFVAYVNDEAFLADTEAALATGEATFTSPNNTDFDTLIDSMTDEDVRALLGPGFDIAAGGPSGEQIAALYKAAGRSDQDFTELAIAWVTEHNPGLEVRYGHKHDVDGDAPREWFWHKDGEVFEDPFLDSLIEDFVFDEDSAIDKAFHGKGDWRELALNVTRLAASHEEKATTPGAGRSIPVQVHMEGVSGNEWREGDYDDKRWKKSQETSAETDRVFSLVFPGKNAAEVLGRQHGYSAHYDDNNGTENGHDGTDGKARNAIEIVAPELLGWQVTVASGLEGLEIVNSTRFGSTGVIADDIGQIGIDVSDNGGDVRLDLSNFGGADIRLGSGEEIQNIAQSAPETDVTAPFIPEGGASATGDGDVSFEIGPGVLDGEAPLSRQDYLDDLVGETYATFVDPDSGAVDRRGLHAEIGARADLAPAEQDYVVGQVGLMLVTPRSYTDTLESERPTIS